MLACSGPPGKQAAVASIYDTVAFDDGAQLVARHCTGCHLLPSPDLADAYTWEHHILPKMGPLLGVRSDGFRRYPDERSPENNHLFPPAPVLTPAEWRRLVSYFVHTAPVGPLPTPDRLRPRQALPHFTPHTGPPDLRGPIATLVQFVPGGFLLGDGAARTLSFIGLGSDSSRILLRGVVPSAWRDMGAGSGYLLDMGTRDPSDARRGRLLRLYPDGRTDTLLRHLPRPVHAAYLDRVGDTAVVVSGFGNYLGELTYYPSAASPQVLLGQAGATRCEVIDLDRDGQPELLCLMAQGDEGIFRFDQQPDGTWTPQRLLRFPPVYGSSYFETAWFAGDSLPSLLVTQGDNGDYPPIVKPYHGIRIFRADATGQYHERQFIPLPGATKVLARDFDLDGDLDLAAIAYFPDYATRPAQGFVYLQNQGGERFRAFTLPEAEAGKWSTLDAGDPDGDGDTDLILGNSMVLAGRDPDYMTQRWRLGTPRYLYLENTIRNLR
ncbi:MAG: hypothetical protein OHK0039_40360 [Bacteroidia bacterium]